MEKVKKVTIDSAVVMRNLMTSKLVSNAIKGEDEMNMENEDILKMVNEMSADEILGTKKSKKTSNERRKSTSGISRQTSGKGMGEKMIPIPPFKYAVLVPGAKLNVVFDKHDIPYKEQLWNVPIRTVEYSIELVKMPMYAYNIVNEMFHNIELAGSAMSGNVAVYSIRTYEDVKFCIKELGAAVIRYSDKTGKLEYSIELNKKGINQCEVNIDKIKKNVAAQIKRLVEQAKNR